MSTQIPINPHDPTAPTPQNTPLQHAPIAAGLSRPTVPDIKEDNEEEEVADLEETDIKRAMLGLVHGRLADLVGRSSGYVESLPADVRLNIEGLKGVQVKQTELQNQYKHECLELEKKYLVLQRPLYERRKEIIAGKAKPTAEEIQAGEESSKRDDPEYTGVSQDGVDPSSSGIPEFWLTALRNHIALADLITDRDAEALKHLDDITIEYLTSGEPGFTLQFHFSPNEYFTNTVLTKTYVYQKEIGYSGDFVYDHAKGCTIEWKEDKDLTKEVEVKKQRNKNTNRTRLVRKTRPTDSFFNFFSPPTPPKEDEETDLDEEEMEELEEKLELDYQLGEDFKEKIIPRAIDYFTGKALELEGLDSDEDDYEDLDDDDDDEFDDDDDSDNDIPVTKGRAPPKGRGGNSNSVDPEECKQQ